MKNLKLLFAFLILSICSIQCTDEDSVEAAQYEAQYHDGGEDEADDFDSVKD